jgi:hypothetical protein
VTADPPADRPDRAAVGALLRAGIVAAIAVFLALAMLLTVRRLAGALQMPLSTWGLLAVGGLAAAAAGGLRGAWRPPQRAVAVGSWADGFVRYAPSLALLMTAGSVSLRQSPPIGLVGCWALVLGQEFWIWRFAWAGARRTPASVDPLESHPRGPRPALRAEPLQECIDPRAQDIYQRLTRAHDATGQDLLYGSLRADLAADQRATAVHVAFCPPFPCTPEVVVDQLAGPAAEIKPAQVLPYGARLDVRLARVPPRPASVVFEVAVRAAATPAATRPADAPRP